MSIQSEPFLPFPMVLPHEKGDWPPDYEKQFWAEYPIKIAKSTAMRSLAKVRKAGNVKFADVMAGLARYKQWLKGPGWRPEPKHPSTWINSAGWEDEYPESVQPVGSGKNGRVTFADIARGR